MAEINKRETFKEVTLDGRTFRIQKFDALTGSYVAYRLMAEALPFGMGAEIGVPQTGEMKLMSKKDFKELQLDCLRVCFETLPAGITCVVNDNGSFGVPDLENDTKTVLALTIHALMFNISSFFGESLLDSIAKGIQGISQQTVQTSTSSSMGQ